MRHDVVQKSQFIPMDRPMAAFLISPSDWTVSIASHPSSLSPKLSSPRKTFINSKPRVLITIEFYRKLSARVTAVGVVNPHIECLVSQELRPSQIYGPNVN